MRTTEIASRGGRWVALALMAPPLVMVAATSLTLLMGLAGRHPFFDGGPATLCEAVAMGDGAEALRLIRGGQAVNGLCTPATSTWKAHLQAATPLEIAARGRRSDLVALLTAEGARPDEAAWRAVLCQPAEHTAELRAVLEPYVLSESIVCGR